METEKVNFKQLITSVTAVLAVEITLDILMSGSHLHAMAILGIKRIIQASLIILIIFFQDKGISAIGLKQSGMLHGLKRGLIWSAAFGAAVFLGFAVLYIFKIDPLALIHCSLPENGWILILFFTVGGVLGPVTEEIFFRGILYGFLRRWGITAALLGSSFLFSLTHLLISGVFITQFIGGLLFAASYEREKSLVTPIAIHALGNLAIFTLSLWN
ncbi:MAG: CPBP family intramembrane metalloprotease [Deltaproteobacteria bacterium]|nr:CPBP family intramembrane metalloprotease [Deltaproteobacteria bacterium]